MTFPISITGTISLPKETSDLRGVEEVCGQVDNLLESARATIISRQDGSIVFTAGIFRTVTSWNVLVAINYGKIVVEDAGSIVRISYFASTVEMLILVTLMLCIISAWAIYNDPKGVTFPALHPLWIAALGWFWLFGGNYFLAAFRFPRWLERGLRRAS
jgi:hypothetical protein